MHILLQKPHSLKKKKKKKGKAKKKKRESAGRILLVGHIPASLKRSTAPR